MGAKTRCSLEGPRNVWSRLLTFLATVKGTNYLEAQDILDRLKFRREFTPDIANIYWSIFEEYTSDDFGWLRANIPADTARIQGAVPGFPPFLRRLKTTKLKDTFAMVLPPPVTTPDFIIRAANFLAAQENFRKFRVHLVLAPSPKLDVVSFVESVGRQEFQGSVGLTIFSETASRRAQGTYQNGAVVEFLGRNLLSTDSEAYLKRIADNTDLVVFLSGNIRIDEGFVARLAHTASVSDNIVQGLVPGPTGSGLQTAFTMDWTSGLQGAASFLRSARLQGNFAVPSVLVRRVGTVNYTFW